MIWKFGQKFGNTDYLYLKSKRKTFKSMNKKQVIRLNESQLRRIVSESVKKILQEKYSYTKLNENKLKQIGLGTIKNILNERLYDSPNYYWTISRQNAEEETLECLYGPYTPGMGNPKSFDEYGFTSPNTAFKYGMKFLKDNFDEFKEGYYCLEVVDEETGDIVRYTTVKNGKVQHKF